MLVEDPTANESSESHHNVSNMVCDDEHLFNNYLARNEKKKKKFKGSSYLTRFIERFITKELDPDVLCLFMDKVSLHSFIPDSEDKNLQSTIESFQNLILERKHKSLGEFHEEVLERLNDDIREFKKTKRRITTEEANQSENYCIEIKDLEVEYKMLKKKLDNLDEKIEEKEEEKEKFIEKIEKFTAKKDADGANDRAISRAKKNIKKLEKSLKEVNISISKYQFEKDEKEKKMLQNKNRRDMLEKRKEDFDKNSEDPFASDGQINWTIKPWNNFKCWKKDMEAGGFTTLTALKKQKVKKLAQAVQADDWYKKIYKENYRKAKNLIAQIVTLIWEYHKQATGGTNSNMLQVVMMNSLEQLLDEGIKASKALAPNQKLLERLERRMIELRTNLKENRLTYKPNLTSRCIQRRQ